MTSGTSTLRIFLIVQIIPIIRFIPIFKIIIFLPNYHMFPGLNDLACIWPDGM